jgi:hypothetical protein
MRTNRIYYHVIEEGSYGEIASHGYYTTLAEAQQESDRLSSFFVGLAFYVYQSPSKREPEICTI